MTIRSLNKLRPGDVATLGDGNWSDGGGLYLWSADNGRRRSWIFRYTINGRVREMGLGAGAAVPLKAARAKRDELRALLDQGLDPLAERRRRQAESQAKKTFAEVAALTIEKKRRGWKGTSSLVAWTRTLTQEAKPLALRPIDEIGVDEVKRIVAPLWEAGLRTQGRPRKGGLAAARLSLTRIATVFDVARAHGWRSSDNPAAWSIFRHILPEGPKAANHHRSVDWRDAPEIMARLRQSASMSALALEFAILTGTRIGETVGATWDEFDPDWKLWIIPAARTKRSVEHAVPLSARAAAILTALRERRSSGSKIIFRGGPRQVVAPLQAKRSWSSSTARRASKRRWRRSGPTWRTSVARCTSIAISSPMRPSGCTRKSPTTRLWRRSAGRRPRPADIGGR